MGAWTVWCFPMRRTVIHSPSRWCALFMVLMWWCNLGPTKPQGSIAFRFLSNSSYLIALLRLQVTAISCYPLQRCFEARALNLLPSRLLIFPQNAVLSLVNTQTALISIYRAFFIHQVSSLKPKAWCITYLAANIYVVHNSLVSCLRIDVS